MGKFMFVIPDPGVDQDVDMSFDLFERDVMTNKDVSLITESVKKHFQDNGISLPDELCVKIAHLGIDFTYAGIGSVDAIVNYIIYEKRNGKNEHSK